ncbi:hypothetical protein PAESOLCIP111_03638 [Paenibacillus solanacearum]|uniref:Histidine kinase n=1 Tax=Paenibacillus solanacearum TaxID=2048548 RepID=A0A916K376_9BACL|nr:sensor histidine kinase [Paenibacillus solanacearum]CAG7635216.1 hypothetical protein PAESOLCIP111_03638 [Paenibacillus solanacearum]
MSKQTKSKRNLFQRMTLRTKIVILFVLLIGVPLSVQGIITYIDFSSSVERRTIDYTGQIVRQMSRSLDQILREEMQKISLLPLYHTDVMSILEKYVDSAPGTAVPSPEERNKMFHYIAGSTYYRPEVRGIQLIAGNGYIFTNRDPYLIRSFIRPEREDWYAGVVQAGGAWVMIPQHHPDYMSGEAATEAYVSAARLIRDPGSSQVVGMMVIDFGLDIFGQISANDPFGHVGNLFVLGEQNELFYEQNNDGLESATKASLLKSVAPKEDGSKRWEIGGKPYLTVSDYSSYSGLKVVSLIPVAALRKETEGFRAFTAITFTLCLLAASGLAGFFSFRLSEPLTRLTQKMQLVGEGQFKQQVPVDSEDEIGRLSQGFNQMTGEIDRLVNEVYGLRLKEQEAQLSALLSQMNPHFIYNTLESVNMMAIRSQMYDISDMVSALGSLLRHSVGPYDRLVPLQEELDSVAAYVRIQQLRYGDRIKAVIQADEELRPLHVPRLMLQPLVENAIYHGLDELEAGGTIWISADRFRDELLITVRDNGRGLSEADIERLRQSMASDEQEPWEGHGLALRNINRRLILMYGADYGLDMDGSPGAGASFTITIPLLERKDTLV